MNIILFDDEARSLFLPMVYTRPVGDLRIGILTIKEKWELISKASVSLFSEHYLRAKFTPKFSKQNIYINARLIPSEQVLNDLLAIKEGQAICTDDFIVGARYSAIEELKEIRNLDCQKPTLLPQHLEQVSDIFRLNDQEIRSDFIMLTAGKKTQTTSKTNTLIGNHIFVEEGARIEASVLNSESGPIYIGRDAEIMEGSLIRGPFALGKESVVKMGAKIYGATTVGPQSKVGGELNNVVIQSRSNKAHDGFLGNSVIGEWCNLGADTNCSNLKNNYASVKLWNFTAKRFLNTGLQFCGLIMGDHSKCGINTMFNTGTVVGVSTNIFGSGFPRNFVPSFTWGGSTGFSTYSMGKVIETADKVMQRRGVELNQIDKEILKHIFEISAEHRFWEKKPSLI